MDRKQIDLEIDRTMDTYRELDAVNVSENFFAGVQRKVRLAESPVEQQASWWKLSLASAAMAVILLVNVLTFVTVVRSDTGKTVDRQAVMAVLVDDYGIKTAAFDLESGQ